MRHLATEWRSLLTRVDAAHAARDAKRLAEWHERLPRLAAETARLKAEGKWRSGPRTLLEVVGLHHRELPLVAALEWLLSPDGHHGLGDVVLAGFLQRVGVAYDRSAAVSVRREETRQDAGGATRADLVLRVGGTCVLVEAKVHAGEQVIQCDRLERLWRDEAPVLVFLTRRGDRPADAPLTAHMWRRLMWRDLASIAENAAADRVAAPGVLDVVQTLRCFHD
jgi:hypothetical protein